MKKETIEIKDLVDFVLKTLNEIQINLLERAKVFNKENEYQFFGDEIGFTQGVGISYDVEFDSFSELISSLKKSRKEK